LSRVSCEFYLLIYAKINFCVHIRESRYDKMLKTHDYFQNIKIIAVLILTNFLFYMQNTIQCLQLTIADFMCLYLQKHINIYEKIDMVKF